MQNSNEKELDHLKIENARLQEELNKQIGKYDEDLLEEEIMQKKIKLNKIKNDIGRYEDLQERFQEQ